MTKPVKKTTKPAAKKAAKVRLSGFGARDGLHIVDRKDWTNFDDISAPLIPWDKLGLGKTLPASIVGVSSALGTRVSGGQPNPQSIPRGLELDSEDQPRTFNKVIESIGVTEFLFLSMMFFLVGLMAREALDLARLLT